MFTRSHRINRLTLFAAMAAVATLSVAACGQKGSSGTQAPAPQASAVGCAPAKGDQLVLLADDKHLQNSDNIVAAVNTKAATPALLGALNKIDGLLDQPKLLALNKAVDIDRKTPQVAAKDFADANNLPTFSPASPNGKVVVGAANFAESQTLAELYKIALDGSGFQATVQQSTNRELYEPALERGEITVFPEYAATLTEFLNQKANGKAATPKASGDITATMAALTDLGTKYGLSFGTPSTASDQNAFAVTKTLADRYGLKTLSDFAAKCSGAASVIAGPAECPQRPFCQPGLFNTYHIEFGRFFEADAGGPRSKGAVTNGDATIGLVFSSDSSLTPA
jgi:osmoprotectant transport system substrate-binding protein